MPKFSPKLNPKTKTIRFDLPVDAFQQYATQKEEDTVVNLDISDADYLALARAAHVLGITFDHFIERVLVDTILRDPVLLKKVKRIRSKRST